MAKVLPEGLDGLIKSTSRAAVLAAEVPGLSGAQRVAQLADVSAGTVSKWGGEVHEGVHMPLDTVFLLEFTTQRPVFARALAGLTGHRLVPVEAEAAGATDFSDVLALTSRHADVLKAYAEALADGDLTPRERRELSAHLALLADQVAHMQRRLSPVPEL